MGSVRPSTRLIDTTASPDLKEKQDLRPVFLDLIADGKPIGRIVLQLEDEQLPKTCQNFRALITGRYVNDHGKKLDYMGCMFHAIHPDSGILASGDVEYNNGTGGESIYGKFFGNEGQSMGFGRPGTLAMLSFGPRRNNSQFFICLDANEDAYPGSLAFGYVTQGLDVLKEALKYGSSPSGEPTAEVKIGACGHL